MKKYIIAVLASVLVLSSVLPATAQAQENRGNTENVSEQNNKFSKINKVEKFVKVDNNGHIGLKFVPPGQYKKHNLSELEAHFNVLNEKVDNGEIIIKDLKYSRNSLHLLCMVNGLIIGGDMIVNLQRKKRKNMWMKLNMLFKV